MIKKTLRFNKAGFAGVVFFIYPTQPLGLLTLTDGEPPTILLLTESRVCFNQFNQQFNIRILFQNKCEFMVLVALENRLNKGAKRN